MKRRLRLYSALLILCLLVSMLFGCKKEQAPTPKELSIYASFYPLYALTQLLVEDVPDVHLHCLVQPQDGCLRNYVLSDWDFALLSRSADIIVMGGNGLEGFEPALYALGENGPVLFGVLNGMGMRHQVAINTDPDTESHWLDENPHVYMKIENALEIVERIAVDLQLLDAENSQLYANNLENAKNRLKSLEDEAHQIATETKNMPVILMNEALIYLAEEFELSVDLCYERESGEGLYDHDLTACLDALSESQAQVVLLEKQAPKALVTALEDAGYVVACIDVLSTHHASEGSDGYFEAQLENARAVQAAFAAVQGVSGGKM